MRILFMFTVLFLTAVVELWLGNCAVLLPLVGSVVFYFTMSFGSRFGLFAALAGGMFLELVYLRCFWLTGGFLGVWGMGVLWARSRQSTTLAAAVLPGFLLGALALLPWFGWRFAELGWHRGQPLHAAVFIMFAMLFGAAWLPLLIWWLDWCARHLGLPVYVRRDES